MLCVGMPFRTLSAAIKKRFFITVALDDAECDVSDG
ncbi:hypothetical protein PSYRMG_14630 [Pseudomonas syringae UMAF0158]|jgi:hypothetical protein|nr:hypothetical protein PSYRMG_14630 [Pseudomonas syringae UMAF0158]